MDLIDDSNTEVAVKDTTEPIVIIFHHDNSSKASSTEDLIKSIPSFEIPRRMPVMSIRFSTAFRLYCYEVYLNREQTLTKETMEYIQYEISNAHRSRGVLGGKK